MRGTGHWVRGMDTWHNLFFTGPPIYLKKKWTETGTWNHALTVGKMGVWGNEDGLATDMGLVHHCALLSSYYFIIMRMWIWYYNRCEIQLAHAVALKLKRCVSHLPIIHHWNEPHSPSVVFVFGNIDPLLWQFFFIITKGTFTLTKAIGPWLLRILEIALVESVIGFRFWLTRGYFVDHDS